MSKPALPVPRLQYRWERLAESEIDRTQYPEAQMGHRCHQEYLIPPPRALEAVELSEGQIPSTEFTLTVTTSTLYTNVGLGPGYGWIGGEPIAPIPMHGMLDRACFGNAPLYAISPEGRIWHLDDPVSEQAPIHSGHRLIYDPTVYDPTVVEEETA